MGLLPPPLPSDTCAALVFPEPFQVLSYLVYLPWEMEGQGITTTSRM